MWQYSQSGTCPGINPPVDLNWFYGTRAQLEALAVGSDWPSTQGEWNQLLDGWSATGPGKKAWRQAVTTQPAAAEIIHDSVASGVNDLQTKVNTILGLVGEEPDAKTT